MIWSTRPIARSQTPPKWGDKRGVDIPLLTLFLQSSLKSLTTFSRLFDDLPIMPSYLAPMKVDPASLLRHVHRTIFFILGASLLRLVLIRCRSPGRPNFDWLSLPRGKSQVRPREFGVWSYGISVIESLALFRAITNESPGRKHLEMFGLNLQ